MPASRPAAPVRDPDGRLAQWVCARCGWTYDPADGDPYRPIPPGLAFEDLPDDWHCPNCGADRDYFFP